MAYTKTNSNGDVLLANTMPKAEYMYGCMPTSVGMLLGYYDLYGYQGADMSNIIAGNVAINSRGSDGDKYNKNEFNTALGRAIASPGYVERFYSKDGTNETTPDEELPYTYKSGTTDFNTDEWDCLADYLGTGQYWRHNSNLSTTETSDTLNDLYTKTYSKLTITYGSTTLKIPWRNISMVYGLDLYVQSRGYSLDRKNTGSFDVDTNGGKFTFEDFKKEIDAGRPVIVSITGHAMVAYGYNPNTREIIFDDCYDSDKRMTWGGTYYYSGKDRAIQSIITIAFKVSGSTTTDTVKPTVSNVKVSTTAVTNQNVTVVATFSDNVSVKSALYRIDSGSWTAYPTGGVTVTKNATVYFKAVDTSGNESSVVSYKVTNIDKTPPSKPTASASTTAQTTNPVTVTAKFSSDTATKQYSTDGKTWKTYSGGLKFTANGTVYFRGADAAGNYSDVTTYKVTNIKGSTPAPTPGPEYDTSDCDNNYNDWMYDKKTNVANTSLYFNTLSPDMELPVDKGYSVSKNGWHNYVGYKDEIDYKLVRLSSAAKLNFTFEATGASKFTVYSLTSTGKTDKNGHEILKQKTLKTVTLKEKNGSYSGSIKDLLLEKSDSETEYYVSMQSTKASKGGSAYYNVFVDSDSVFFTKGNNADDSKTVSAIGSIGAVGSPGVKLLGDWVGFGDKIDYRRFTLSSAARLSFSVKAGDAVKFTLYQVAAKTSKKGTVYSLKSVQTLTVKKGETKATSLRLLQSGNYAFSVESTNAAKGGNADYSVNIASDSSFFNHADRNNSDDDVIINGYVNPVAHAGYLDNTYYSVISTSAWVGYGDTIDYKRFSLMNNADLTFGISSGDAVQFTLYQLETKTTKSGSKSSLKKLKSKTIKKQGDSYVADDINVSLKAGTDYYFSVKSTNASKGGSAEYFVFVSANPYGSSHSSALTGPEDWSNHADSFASSLDMPEAAYAQDDLNLSLADSFGALQQDMPFADASALCDAGSLLNADELSRQGLITLA